MSKAGAAGAPDAAPRLRRADPWVALALAVLGPLVALREMLASGLERIPGNVLDGRLVPLFLEHSWRWLIREPLHRELWDLPFFYPAPNTLAFSDAMLSFGPFYWPWRALGLPADTSYQLWLPLVLGVSAVAGYAFFRALGLSLAAASLATWLAVFAASRLHHISHPQLLPELFLFAGLLGVLTYARAARRRVRLLGAGVLMGALVAQLYGGFYLGLFLALALALLFPLALALPATRRVLLPRLREDWAVLLLCGLAAAALLVPWVRHYSAASELVGGRTWAEIAGWAPRPRSWLYVSPRALAYRALRTSSFFDGLSDRFEHAISLGWLTSLLCVTAAWAGRRDPRVQLAAGLAVALVLLTTRFGAFCAWEWVVAAVPPLAAARVVARVGLLLPLVAGVLLGCWLDGTRGRRRAVVVVLVLLAAAEQLATLDDHRKSVQRHWQAELARRVPRDADAFYAVRTDRWPPGVVLHLDAMEVAMQLGVPTVNGGSGVQPPAWTPLDNARERSPGSLDQRLRRWLSSAGAAEAKVAIVRVPPTHRGGDGRRAGRPAAGDVPRRRDDAGGASPPP